jgi:hypothetical protein
LQRRTQQKQTLISRLKEGGKNKSKEHNKTNNNFTTQEGQKKQIKLEKV